MSILRTTARVFLGCSASVFLASCSSVGPLAPSAAIPTSLALHGVVHGGQQPVTGATITLWAVGTTGDGSAAGSLTSTTTDGTGSFTLGTYTCPGSDPDVYLTASGGDPGIGSNNPNILMMAALTDCNTVKANASSTFVFVDEVTTLGAVAALSPYLTATGNLSHGSADAAAFATAFSSVAEYTNTTTGAAPGPSLPSGQYASSTEINTLGNVLAYCINSAGGSAVGGSSSDGSACGNLFNITRSGGVAPTNTLGATLNIINNPSQNVSSLFNLEYAVTPFQPVDAVAPTTWALPIQPMAAPPTFSVAGGTYGSAQFVTLSDTTPGAVIYYAFGGLTPNNSDPTATSTAITVSATETISAYAVASGYGPSTVASATYTITGSSATYMITGQIYPITNGCGNNSFPSPNVTLTQGSTIIETAPTSSGSFTLYNVPNGTYTITPSIAGAGSIFYPASQTVVVNGNDVNGTAFNASIGYTVSGTVSYSGNQTGAIYLALTTSCGEGGTYGTSISAPGAYTIRGVPPGSYALVAFMDNLGKGNANAANPTSTTSVSVNSTNVTGAAVNLADPGTVTLSSGPSIQGASGFNTGAVVEYQDVTNNFNIEQPTSYTLQWSTDPTFGSVTGSKTFAANGTKANVWLLNGLTNGSILYFRAYASSAGTAQSQYSSIYGPVTIGAPTGNNYYTLSGAVSFAATPTGPIYIVLLSQTNGAVFAEYFPNPASAQAYSVQAPADTYNFFAILDQNSDGLIDAGDIQDATDSNNSTNTVVVSASNSNLNLTLPNATATATVTTQAINSGSSSTGYDLNLTVNGLAKLPVAVSLTSGPNLLEPIDIALCGGLSSNCGHGFQINLPIGTTSPSVGDTYVFGVTYSDGTTGTVSAAVTAVLSAFPTGLSPQTGTSSSTTPTFTWTDPANASNYVYSFSLCCGTNGNIWNIPGQNSSANGFSSSITSIPWNTDPTGGGSLPSVGSLSLNTSYSWSIQVQDSNGNSAQTQVQYQP